MKRLTLILCLIASPALAHEFLQGGVECDIRVPYSTCQALALREAVPGPLRLDGWYKSADTVYLASPKACIVRGSDTQFLFHAAIDPRRARGVIPSAWNGIVRGRGDAWYNMMMERSPWGKRIFAKGLREGWFDTIAYTTLTGEEAIALGVPACGSAK